MALRIPDKLLLGVATAATQIEGGDTNNSWYDWYRQGYIHDGSDPSVANEHYRLFREDTELLGELGIQCYRFGVEWSRIEPDPNHFDEAVIRHYREELTELKRRGIRPLLTLHHFTNPLWFERMGAFENDDNLELFVRFVRYVVTELGDLVSEYITINEPNVYAFNGYLFGLWPPAAKSFRRTLHVLQNLTVCHIAAYKEIHALRENMGYDDTRVGVALHMRVFAPKNRSNPRDRLCCALAERSFQAALLSAFCLGKPRLPLHREEDIERGEWCDFHGVNYYSRSTVSGLKDGVRKDAPVNDLGWEIYPAGIVGCARSCYKLLPRPIYITENGVCDNSDAYRVRFLVEHLKALVESGLPVERYYHWCFIDNFEWLEGRSARFGLVSADEQTQIRIVKPSGLFYQELIQSHCISDEREAQAAAERYPMQGTQPDEPKHEP